MARGEPLILAGRLLVGAMLVAAVVLALTELTGITRMRGALLTYAVEHDVLAVLLVGYAVLLSIPFVPGVTLGFAIMMIFGPQTAPVVWLASVCGLVFSYSLGRIAPRRWITPLLLRAGLAERARYLRPARPYSERQRLEGLFGVHPLVRRLIGWRYLALAVLVMIPGNVLIGGAGGISLLAGLSRAFRPVWFMLAVGLPMLPLPLAVWLFGIDILPPVVLP